MDKIQQDTPEISLRNIILRLIEANQGLKAVELVCKVMGVVNPLMFDGLEYQREIDRLIQEGEILEVEYILPQLNYRVKSMYFPKGTEFHGKNIFGHNAKNSGI